MRASQAKCHISSSNAPSKPTTHPSAPQDILTSCRSSKSDIWNHLENFSEDNVRKTRCKHYPKFYLFPLGNLTSHLKRYLEKAHSPSEPQQTQFSHPVVV